MQKELPWRYPRQYISVSKHFVHYLIFKRYVDIKSSISKEKFKTIFEEEYKLIYPVRASSANVLSALHFINFIKKPNSKHQIIFNQNVVDKLETKSIDALQKHPDVRLAKPKHEKFVDQQFAFNPTRKLAPVTVELRCELCKIQFNSVTELQLHLKELDHVLRDTYRLNRRALDGRLHHVNICTVTDSVKIVNEECLVRLGKPEDVAIVIKNTDKLPCNFNSIHHLIPSPEIQMKCPLPCIVKPGNVKKFNVKVHFTEFAAVIYPVIFCMSKGGKEFFALHEMIFRIQSEEIDDLMPVTKYKRPVRKLLHTTELPTIPGVEPPSSGNPISYVVHLPEYPLPADLRYIFNNGFKEMPEMKQNVKQKLKEIRSMLKKSPNNAKVIADMNIGNYSKFMSLLLYMEEHQMLHDINMYNLEDKTMKLHSNKRLCILQVPGLTEKRPSVMKRDRIVVQIKGDKEDVCYEGIVHAVRDLEVHLGFSERFLKKFLENMKLTIKFKINRYPLRLQHRALKLLEDHKMKSLMFPSIYNHSSSTNIKSWFNRLIETNEEQKLAVSNIVAGCSNPSPYIVYGPPGTGKTVTIVESILQIWKLNPTTRILACAPSNSAADVLTLRLLKHIPPSRILRLYADSCLGEKIPIDIKQCSNFSPKEDTFLKLSVEAIMKKNIVVSTLINAGKLVSAGFPDGHFNHLFVDECGHAQETDLLVPVSGLFTSKSLPGKLMGQITLAGDPKQLGPILRSVAARTLGLGTSFLERQLMTNVLYKKDKKTQKFNFAVITKLVKNFRSHKVILKVPNELFYDSELKACGGDIINIACNWSQLPKKQFPLVFHGIQGQDERQADSPSYFNRQEVDVVSSYVQKLLEERLSGYKVQEKDIGIITPYNLQVKKFRKMFEKKKWSGLTVGSVEEFQGQERLIIIISTVRSRVELLEEDYKHHLGFLRNPKRFNVAVTRAKALLIVVGNPNVLQFDLRWRKLIEFCQANGAYKGCKFQMKADNSNVDDELGFAFSNLSLDGSSNVVDGPQWRDEI